jgi:hypothetical protein
MKFLCICYYDAKQFAGMTEETGKALQSICAPQDKLLHDSGHLDLVGSLGLPEQSKTIRAEAGSVAIVDGPYAPTPEPFGAFFILEAENIDEAVKIAGLHPGAHIGHIIRGGIEVRPIEFFEKP